MWGWEGWMLVDFSERAPMCYAAVELAPTVLILVLQESKSKPGNGGISFRARGVTYSSIFPSPRVFPCRSSPFLDPPLYIHKMADSDVQVLALS